MAEAKIKVECDSTALDEAIEKADELKDLLEDIIILINKIQIKKE